MTTPQFEIGGREITLPLRVRDGDQWSAQYFVSATAARALVGSAELELVQPLPRRAMAMITFARYRDTDLGRYEELVISFLARRRDAAAAPNRWKPFRRGRGEIGIYPCELPTSKPLAVEAGQTIWGYPRSLAEIAIIAERGRAQCSLIEDGASLMWIEVREGGPLKLSDPNLPNFSRREGILRMSPWDQEGDRARPSWRRQARARLASDRGRAAFARAAEARLHVGHHARVACSSGSSGRGIVRFARARLATRSGSGARTEWRVAVEDETRRCQRRAVRS